MNKIIKVLGIESSCDDTGVAIINSDRKILSNIVISQNQEHQPYQGVVPEIAARSHMQNLDIALNRSLKNAHLILNDIDVIAATSGPGLIGGVIVGCMYGKAMASALNKPFIAVNHLEGHALTARLTNMVSYPYLLLLVSGGHCQFVAVKNLGNYQILGRTLDDAVGEAFDKVAKMLNLGFPGGPIIEQRAIKGDANKYLLPKPLFNREECDMSFSGLKTAVRLVIEQNKNLKNDQKLIDDLAASFQKTVGLVLENRLINAIKMYETICNGKQLVIAGGVASNGYIKRLLERTANSIGYDFIAPIANLCTDNAAMIAYAGLERFRVGLTNGLNFKPKARWSLEDL